MAKKRKGSARQAEDAKGPNLDVGESRKRIRDFEDVADSDDEFHLNQDRILLDEQPEAKRRRKWQEQEEFLQPSDEEVLGYSDVDEDEDDAGLALGNGVARSGRDGVASDSENSDDEAGDDEEDDTGWGMSREDIYGADAIETEEQALEEEAEALRLQKKQLQSMTVADYGFGESEWQHDSASKHVNEGDQDNVVTEVLPQVQISDDMSPAERLKILKTRYPEFEPLSKELLALKEHHAALIADFQQRSSYMPSENFPNAAIKLRASSAYLGALAMYFVLLTSPASDAQQEVFAMSAAQLRDHPVMDSLVSCREVWLRAKNLPDDLKPTQNKTHSSPDGNGVVSHNLVSLETLQQEKRPATKSRAQRHAEAALAAAEERKAKRLQKTEANLADLDALVTPSLKRSLKSKRRTHENDETGSDIGEAAPLTAHEAAENAKRKKSLRFYTSQIAQKANKRGAAGRNAGGDDDIPYRERLKDRQARLNAEAEKRGQRTTHAGADLGGESDDDDARQAQEIRAGGQDDDYYDLVASKTAKKKTDKAAFAEAQRQAALQGGQVIQEERVGPDGKRKITYAIEKNKGLTPHRKKEVRNPRVKKRKKFDEKKKKLASVKPVYKGGEGRGGYGGELTGIKKGLVKSTKL